MALEPVSQVPLGDEAGQAITEYILLIFAVVTFYLIVVQGLARSGLGAKLVAPITSSFAAAYQFGHVKAKGFENGGPSYHPRVTSGENNFRIFIGAK